jgi:hypothetical protein
MDRHPVSVPNPFLKAPHYLQYRYVDAFRSFDYRLTLRTQDLLTFTFVLLLKMRRADLACSTSCKLKATKIWSRKSLIGRASTCRTIRSLLSRTTSLSTLCPFANRGRLPKASRARFVVSVVSALQKVHPWQVKYELAYNITLPLANFDGEAEVDAPIGAEPNGTALNGH